MRRVHCKKKYFDVYVGRPSKWGNPFVIGPDGSRDEVCDKFEDWLVSSDEGCRLLGDIQTELRGKILGCHCDDDERCHADTLLRIANRQIRIRKRSAGRTARS